MPDGLCFSLKWEVDCALPERRGEETRARMQAGRKPQVWNTWKMSRN